MLQGSTQIPLRFHTRFRMVVYLVYNNILRYLYVNSADGKVNGNPIGWLQELCMARRWPPPFYETQSEIGLPHERYFTIACHVSTYSETGQFFIDFNLLAEHCSWFSYCVRNLLLLNFRPQA